MAQNTRDDENEAEVLVPEVCPQPAGTKVSPLASVVGCSTDHRNYKPANQFNVNDLPREIRCKEISKIVLLNIDLAVNILVEKESGPPMQGSGSICYFSSTHNIFQCNHENVHNCQMCHIPDCLYISTLGENHFMITDRQFPLCDAEIKRAHLAFRVSTNQHVVLNNREARNATVELFYDSEDKGSVVTAKGVCLAEEWEEQDKVHIVCVADIENRVIDLLQSMGSDMRQLFASIPCQMKNAFTESYVIIICHPHGTPKAFSVGIKERSGPKLYRNQQMYIETRYHVETCIGCSGAPVVGPGWEDGGAAYRVHCGVLTQRGKKKCGVSKSFWIVDTDPRGGTAEQTVSAHGDRILRALASAPSYVSSYFCLCNCVRECLDRK